MRTVFQSQFWRNNIVEFSKYMPGVDKIVPRIKEVREKTKNNIFMIQCQSIKHMGYAVKYFCDAMGVNFMDAEAVSIWHVAELSSMNVAYNRFSEIDTSINTFMTPAILAILDIGYETRETASFIRYLFLARQLPILLVSPQDQLITKKYSSQDSITVIDRLGL